MIAVRALRQEDLDAVSRLIRLDLQSSNYPYAARSALEALVGGADPDTSGLIAERGGDVAGVIVHGLIAGSVGAARLQWVVTDPSARHTGVARQLVVASLDALRQRGARVTFVELPGDPSLDPVKRLLTACGFAIETRVRDFYRDGVDLAVYRRDLRTG